MLKEKRECKLRNSTRYDFTFFNSHVMKGSDLACILKGIEEMVNLDNVMKFNYTLEVPFNESFKKAYGDYVAQKGKVEEGVKNYLLEDFLLYYFKDLLDELREDYPEFIGKFVLEMRHEVVKGIFKSDALLPNSLEEPLRRKFFDRCKTLTNRDDLRVDINLGCMI